MTRAKKWTGSGPDWAALDKQHNEAWLRGREYHAVEQEAGESRADAVRRTNTERQRIHRARQRTPRRAVGTGILDIPPTTNHVVVDGQWVERNGRCPNGHHPRQRRSSDGRCRACRATAQARWRDAGL